jgi:single-strand DNA-binding protein
MAGINKVIIIGNLGRDPEVRFTQGGSAVCSLSVAVGERVKKGEAWEDHTEWFRVVVFGKTAENAGQYLQKGRQVYCEGKLRQKEYEDKDGTKKRSTEVVADVLQWLGGKGEGGRDAAPAKATATAVDADDLPF